MRRALAGAAAIVMAAPEAAARVCHSFPELADRVVTGIPIGFEPADFDVAPAGRRDGVFRIVHTGSMHTDFGRRLRATRTRRRLLGGTFPGVDFLTRSHVFILEAIEVLLREQPSLRGRIELHLAGDLTAGDRAIAERHDFVRMPALLPHRETVALMRSADLLFLPMQNLPEGVRAGLIPYKTYEYLAAGRPILAAVPDGDVRDMLGGVGHATLVRPDDVEAMTSALRGRIAAAVAAGGREPDAQAPAVYERSRCVEQIAAVLDGVLAGERQAAPLAA
jgi:glycosyltransferase involved in cell wall biosynthesis